MKERLTARKVLHLILVLALLLALMAYRTWFSAYNSVSANQKKDQICDLSHTPCSALIGDKQLTVAIKELPLRAEHDFAIAISGADPAIKPVKATLEGKDMFMGTIPVSFEEIDGQWQGGDPGGELYITRHDLVVKYRVE